MPEPPQDGDTASSPETPASQTGPTSSPPPAEAAAPQGGGEAAPTAAGTDPPAAAPDAGASAGAALAGASAAAQADHPPSQGGDSDNPRHLRQGLFKRDLDQAYLLIDHITMSVTKHLPAADSAGDIIEKISKIHYPPVGSDAVIADQASSLVHALDELNRAAAPANAMTIAFTLQVLGKEGQTPPGFLVSKSHALRRLELAQDAFPSLWGAAQGFKIFNQVMIYGLIFVFVLTCALSWNVATGNALLGQVTALKASAAAIAKSLAAAGGGAGGSSSGETNEATQPAAGATEKTETPGVPETATSTVYCGAAATSSTKARVIPIDSTTGIPLCDLQSQTDIQLAAARHNLHGWFASWGWISATIFTQTPPSLCPDLSAPLAAASAAKPAGSKSPGSQSASARCTDPDGVRRKDEIEAQWAAALLQVLGGAVLPTFYGLLGAGAAVVRGVSARIRESVLAPRDFMLSQVQLVLGAVIGGCIGLFITPAGSSAQGAPSLLGSVQLSASALCFIAGFGVEGVFVTLETLITRIFNVDDPTKKSAPGSSSN